MLVNADKILNVSRMNKNLRKRNLRMIDLVGLFDEMQDLYNDPNIFKILPAFFCLCFLPTGYRWEASGKVSQLNTATYIFK